MNKRTFDRKLKGLEKINTALAKAGYSSDSSVHRVKPDEVPERFIEDQIHKTFKFYTSKKVGLYVTGDFTSEIRAREIAEEIESFNDPAIV